MDPAHTVPKCTDTADAGVSSGESQPILDACNSSVGVIPIIVAGRNNVVTSEQGNQRQFRSSCQLDQIPSVSKCGDAEAAVKTVYIRTKSAKEIARKRRNNRRRNENRRKRLQLQQLMQSECTNSGLPIGASVESGPDVRKPFSTACAPVICTDINLDNSSDSQPMSAENTENSSVGVMPVIFHGANAVVSHTDDSVNKSYQLQPLSAEDNQQFTEFHLMNPAPSTSKSDKVVTKNSVHMPADNQNKFSSKQKRYLHYKANKKQRSLLQKLMRAQSLTLEVIVGLSAGLGTVHQQSTDCRKMDPTYTVPKCTDVANTPINSGELQPILDACNSSVELIPIIVAGENTAVTSEEVNKQQFRSSCQLDQIPSVSKCGDAEAAVKTVYIRTKSAKEIARKRRSNRRRNENRRKRLQLQQFMQSECTNSGLPIGALVESGPDVRKPSSTACAPVICADINLDNSSDSQPMSAENTENSSVGVMPVIFHGANTVVSHTDDSLNESYQLQPLSAENSQFSEYLQPNHVPCLQLNVPYLQPNVPYLQPNVPYVQPNIQYLQPNHVPSAVYSGGTILLDQFGKPLYINNPEEHSVDVVQHEAEKLEPVSLYSVSKLLNHEQSCDDNEQHSVSELITHETAPVEESSCSSPSSQVVQETQRATPTSAGYVRESVSSFHGYVESEILHDAQKTLQPAPDSKGKKKKPKRLCVFCHGMKKSLSRHIKDCHPEEKRFKDLKEFYAKPGRTEKQVEGLTLARLRKLGIKEQNETSLRQDSKALLVSARLMHSEVKECSLCNGMYQKKTFYKHRPKCEEMNGKDEIAKCLEISAQEMTEGMRELLSRLSTDEVSEIVKNEKIVLIYGEARLRFIVKAETAKYYDKMKNLRTKMRMLAKTIMIFKEKGEARNQIFTSDDFLKPAYITEVMDSVQENPSTDMQVQIIHIIKRTIVDLISHYKKEMEMQKATTLVSYLEIFKSSTQPMLTTGIYTRRTKSADARATASIYTLENILKFEGYCKDSLEELQETLHTTGDVNFLKLRQVMVTRLTFMNAKRGNEPARLLLSEYRAGISGRFRDRNKVLTLSKEQQAIDKENFVLMQSGKGKVSNAHHIPVIVPKIYAPALAYLANPETREKNRVHKKNLFLFPMTNGSMLHAQGDHEIKATCKSANIPSNITATLVRHKKATSIHTNASLTEAEVRQASRSFGHSYEVSRANYLDMSGTDHLTGVFGQSMLAMDRLADKYRCSKVKERHSDQENAENSVDGLSSENSVAGTGDTDQPSTSGIKRKKGDTDQPSTSGLPRKKVHRYRWSEEDKEKVRSFFKNFIEDGHSEARKYPGVRFVTKFIEESGVLKDVKDVQQKRTLIKCRIMNEKCKIMNDRKQLITKSS